ncbi:hypothetical protein GCM10027052_25920 [Parafrigoribacterium mesophilum]|uniref:hypothetical protein n=1 Tax=Parafrigoribacterium mesophilum TaxID=433646 RepID=UPI0031FD9696
MDPQTWGGGGAWFALALANAGLAEQKNRSRLRWFAVSLLLGPLATLFIVVWPRVEGDWRTEPVTTLNIVRSVRDRWILALGVTLLTALVVALIGVFAGNWMLALVGVGCLLASAVALSWLLRAKKTHERGTGEEHSPGQEPSASEELPRH